jgi:hypothetical protein
MSELVGNHFLAATHEELTALLKIVDADFRYQRNWDWLLHWCDDTTVWPAAEVIEIYDNEDYWRVNTPEQWRPR